MLGDPPAVASVAAVTGIGASGGCGVDCPGAVSCTEPVPAVALGMITGSALGAAKSGVVSNAQPWATSDSAAIVAGETPVMYEQRGTSLICAGRGQSIHALLATLQTERLAAGHPLDP